MYTIGKFAKKLGITVHTLRVWDKKNRLKPEYVSNGKVLDKTIQSVVIKMRNSEIYLSFSYINENKESTEFTIQNPQELDPIELNRAGIDIGLNNLISLFIDDKKSQSIIVDGARYKYYNSKFNRFIAKLNNSIS